MIQLDLEHRVHAARRRVWEILADHEHMVAWFPAREVVRRRPGVPDPDGVGAVRVVRVAGLALEEKITAFKPHERLEYQVIEGGPLSECRAVVVLSRADEGTRVRWSLALRPLVPGTGWILKRAAERTLARALRGLARAAETG